MPSTTTSTTSSPLVPLTDSELLSLSPYLTKLTLRRNKLAPTRSSKLFLSARSKSKPKKPEIWECCGSSCKPCVLELYREEKRVWEECHPDGEEEEEEKEEEEEENLNDDGEENKKGDPKVEIGIERQIEDMKISIDEQELGTVRE
ncbi:hypothetical protein JCM5350_002625 [Sporobolomyces pararoseus]